MSEVRKQSSNRWVSLLRSWALIALGVLLAATIVPGIYFEGNIFTLVLIVLVLSVLNAILRPVLILFTLPFVLLTLGLGLVLINALLLWFTGQFVPGFEVNGFWPPIGGALIIGLTSMIANMILGKGNVRIERSGGRRSKSKSDDDRFIDV